MAKLIYTGRGFVAGVPARDLTEAEAEEYGGAAALVQSGAYQYEQPEPEIVPAPKKIKKTEE